VDLEILHRAGASGRPSHARLRAASALFLASARLELPRTGSVGSARTRVEHRRVGIAHEVLFSPPRRIGCNLKPRLTSRMCRRYRSVAQIPRDASGNCARSPNDGRNLVIEDDEEDCRNYLVVRNSEEQYSIWPSHKPVPRGWQSLGKEARKTECLRIIEEMWVDMRPRSLEIPNPVCRRAVHQTMRYRFALNLDRWCSCGSNIEARRKDVAQDSLRL
jgi:MbtH protein